MRLLNTRLFSGKTTYLTTTLIIDYESKEVVMYYIGTYVPYTYSGTTFYFDKKEKDIYQYLCKGILKDN